MMTRVSAALSHNIPYNFEFITRVCIVLCVASIVNTSLLPPRTQFVEGLSTALASLLFTRRGGLRLFRALGKVG